MLNVFLVLSGYRVERPFCGPNLELVTTATMQRFGIFAISSLGEAFFPLTVKTFRRICIVDHAFVFRCKRRACVLSLHCSDWFCASCERLLVLCNNGHGVQAKHPVRKCTKWRETFAKLATCDRNRWRMPIVHRNLMHSQDVLLCKKPFTLRVWYQKAWDNQTLIKYSWNTGRGLRSDATISNHMSNIIIFCLIIGHIKLFCYLIQQNTLATMKRSYLYS